MTQQLKFEKPHLSSVSTFLNNLSKYCLFKNRITIRNSKILKVGLCGLKLEILKEVENSLNEIVKFGKEKWDKEEKSFYTQNEPERSVNSFPNIELVILKQVIFYYMLYFLSLLDKRFSSKFFFKKKYENFF